MWSGSEGSMSAAESLLERMMAGNISTEVSRDGGRGSGRYDEDGEEWRMRQSGASWYTNENSEQDYNSSILSSVWSTSVEDSLHEQNKHLDDLKSTIRTRWSEFESQNAATPLSGRSSVVSEHDPKGSSLKNGFGNDHTTAKAHPNELRVCTARESWRTDIAGTIALAEGERCRLIRYNPERWSLVASLENNHDYVGWFPSELLVLSRDSLQSVLDDRSWRSSRISSALNDSIMTEEESLQSGGERRSGTLQGNQDNPSADRLLLRKAQMEQQERVLEEFWRTKL
eukprot:700294-Hanusia_phi.AAC.2